MATYSDDDCRKQAGKPTKKCVRRWENYVDSHCYGEHVFVPFSYSMFDDSDSIGVCVCVCCMWCGQPQVIPME